MSNPAIKIGVAAAAAVILGIAYLFAAFLGFVPSPFGSDDPEATARYYPPDTWAYATINLNPEGEQRRHLIDIFAQLQDSPAAREISDESSDSIEDNTGIDWEQDIGNWIGPNISLGITDIDIDDDTDIEFAATIKVRDHDAADRFIDTLSDYVEDNIYATNVSRESDYQEFRVWSANLNQFQMHIALSDDMMVFGNDDTFFDVLDRINDSDLNSLYDDEQFKEAKTRFAEPRFATVYVDYDAAEHELASSLTISASGLNDELAENSIRWFAMNAGIHQRAIVADIDTPRVKYKTSDEPIRLANLAKKLSDRTAAFAAANVNLDLDYWRQNVLDVTLEDYFGEQYADYLAYQANDWINSQSMTSRSTISDYLESGIQRLEEIIGINVQTQILDLLTGTSFVAIENTDWNLVFDFYEPHPINAVVAIEYRNGKGHEIARSINTIEDYASSTLGTTFYRTNVNADQPASFISDIPEPYSLGWVTSHGYVIASTTEQALLNAIANLKDEENSILHTPQFARINELMPESAMAYAFLDIHSVIREIDPEVFGFDYDLYGALNDTLDALAISIGENQDHIRTRVAITLFP